MDQAAAQHLIGFRIKYQWENWRRELVLMLAGSEAGFGEFPWVVALLGPEDQYIGVGVLIHPGVVMTGAHVVLKCSISVNPLESIFNHLDRDCGGEADSRVSEVGAVLDLAFGFALNSALSRSRSFFDSIFIYSGGHSNLARRRRACAPATKNL
ncbi:hypothetical protein EVAR_41570_1 [Eumeta japonica]|uniref:Peptidase S1 domain-containing protein n=1 Tax=Eumeta variegata TaxID=151549 RepID=A0A4C1Y205_EUMVA|nr:hypothetical protein EVAR_41570_1 [Eumeta japonica]